MTLGDFKKNIKDGKYYNTDHPKFIRIYNHMDWVEEISSEIAKRCSFTIEESALATISSLIHDMCKLSGKTHADDIADLVEDNELLKRDLALLFYEEFYLLLSQRMINIISFAVRNHQKMNEIERYNPTEEMCKIALIVYAADKIDKFRKDSGYTENKFNNQMDLAYEVLSKKLFISIELKQIIKDVMKAYKK